MPSRLQDGQLQKELDALTKRGYTYKLLANNLVEITNPTTGTKQLKSLNEPSEMEIRAWAVQRGIPILEIDPRTIDTSRFTGWYRYWSTIPLSNGSGVPLVVGDVNRNGKLEVYGIHWDLGENIRSRFYEVDSTGAVSFVHEFLPRMGGALQLSDVDKNGFYEINYEFGDSAYCFEQPNAQSLPIRRKFVFAKDEVAGTAVGTREFIGDLDGDLHTDFLYRGTVLDSLGDPEWRTSFAEYDESLHNFRRVWSTHFARVETGIGGYAVGDYDADGRMDFALSDMFGHVWIAENIGDNLFDVAWRDSVPFVNVFYQGWGDIDNDGKPEVFIGATVGNGDWTTVFEADSDNHYSPRCLIHLLSGGTFDNPQYESIDLDGDGKLELVLCAGADVYVFKSNGDNSYYLWYLKRENARDGIQFYDFNRDGRKDFIISKNIYVDPPGYPHNYADIYVASGLATVNSNSQEQRPEKIALLANFPNPFNPTTAIRFLLPSSSNVRLAIYDMLGREVDVVLDKVLEAGSHTTTWNATGRSSGVYFYQLETKTFSKTMKMLLMR
jgi:hypothetical protein